MSTLLELVNILIDTVIEWIQFLIKLIAFLTGTYLLIFSLLIGFSYNISIDILDQRVSEIELKTNEPIKVLGISYGGKQKPKNFDIKRHRELERTLPDWKERLDWQEGRVKAYETYLQRKREYQRFGTPEFLQHYTPNQLDAIDYFRGTGTYAFHQDLNQPPNIFDSRQSLVLKMHNNEVRTKFLLNERWIRTKSNNKNKYW